MLVLEPIHAATKIGADLFDLVGQIFIHQALVFALPGIVFVDPLACECSVLNVCQHLLHVLAHMCINDPRATGQIAVRSRLADTFVHLLQTPFMQQIDDQL